MKSLQISTSAECFSCACREQGGTGAVVPLCPAEGAKCASTQFSFLSAAKMFVLFITGANRSSFQASPAGSNDVVGVENEKQETSEFFSSTTGWDVWMSMLFLSHSSLVQPFTPFSNSRATKLLIFSNFTRTDSRAEVRDLRNVLHIPWDAHVDSKTQPQT